MNDAIISAIISATIPSIISVIGFIVTYEMNKRNYKEELDNSKTTLNIEKLQSIILDVSNLMNNPNNISVDTYQELVDLCQVFRHIFLRIFINFFKLRLRSCYKY